MRYTVIKGIDTDYHLKLTGDVDIICAVMQISTRGGELTYEADLSGRELLNLFKPLKVTLEGILPDKRYTVTAFDW